MASRLPRLGPDERLLCGVVAEHLADVAADGFTDPLNRGDQVGVVSGNELLDGVAEPLAVMGAIGRVTEADLLGEGGPPHEVHLGGHLRRGHSAGSEVVDDIPE